MSKDPAAASARTYELGPLHAATIARAPRLRAAYNVARFGVDEVAFAREG